MNTLLLKRLLVIFVAVVGIVSAGFLPSPVAAHPGNTDRYGCHTCRTNCPRWGLRYNQYHCHNKKVIPQPLKPITSKRLW